MSDKTPVAVGQVYREKTKRFTRFVVVVGWRAGGGKNEDKPLIRTCSAKGRIYIHGRVTAIDPRNLQTRFELIKER